MDNQITEVFHHTLNNFQDELDLLTMDKMIRHIKELKPTEQHKLKEYAKFLKQVVASLKSRANDQQLTALNKLNDNIDALLKQTHNN